MAEEKVDNKREMINEEIEEEKAQAFKDFDALEEMKKVYPHRIIEAVQFNAKHKTDRRAFGEFMGLDNIKDLSTTINEFLKRVKNPRSKKWGDIFIIYMVDNDKENVDEASKRLQVRPVKHQRIMVALPKNVPELGQILLSIKALKSLREKEQDPDKEAQWANQIRVYQEKLRKKVQWENWTWFYMGGVIDKKKDVTECGVISIFMEKIYSEAFYPGHKALSLHHLVSSVNRRKVRKAIKHVLNIPNPIVITRDARDFTSEILRAAVDMGLLERISPIGWEEEWAVRTDVPEDSPVKPLWEYLYHFVLGKSQAGEEVSFKNVTEKFMEPPYGITSALLKFLFALFWRKYHHQIKLYNYAGGRRTEVGDLTFQRLTDMLRHPDNWKIGRRRETKKEEKYLRSILGVFSPEKAKAEIVESFWKETKKAMLDWYDQLPQLIHQQDFDNPDTSTFLKAIADHKKKNARELLLNHIPAAFGYIPSSLDLEADGEDIQKAIQKSYVEINNISKQLIDDIWMRITKMFGVGTGAEDDFRKKLNDWLDEINAGKYADTYRGDSKVLYEVIKSGNDLKKEFLKVLPVKMNMQDVYEWKNDRTAELIARLDKARFQMSVMKYLQLLRISDPDRKRKFIINYLLKVIKHMEFTTEETEEFLEEYLEEITS